MREHFISRVLRFAEFGRRSLTVFMNSPRLIVVTGFMGCGKTEVSSHLAQRLNVKLTDLDDWITQTEGRSPAQLIREEGERAFREIETRALASVLKKVEAGVIALGGGAWIEATNRELIEAGKAVSVWLDTPFELCWERIEASTGDRPLGRTKEQASELYERRRAIYELAEIRIAIEQDDEPLVIALQIVEQLTVHASGD